MINKEETLSVLIIEDQDAKAAKIFSLIQVLAPKAAITHVKDQVTAQVKLQEAFYDLVILDIQLPLRFDEFDLDLNGGEHILQDLSISDEYIQPHKIIALTEFQDSVIQLRETFPEIGVVQFDNTSLKWQNTLERTIKGMLKGKAQVKKIVYCEGDNASLYNLVRIPGLEFWPLKDSRAIYLSAKNEPDKYALRDRDFLTSKEINILTSPPYFSNYVVLEYYCFENYLFHPDNIILCRSSFDTDEYLQELIRQKKEKFNAIIQDYKLSRAGYIDFTDNDKKTMMQDPEVEIVSDLESDELERFYKFFDMAGKKDSGFKKSFNKAYLEKYNLTKQELVQTCWFKDKISDLFRKKFDL
ncbi:hypothetical protein [Taibaiella chishuiensis]|uniref:Uncharacterized protein n=1 Tax=Taibaiella chishuiensis TaxID=1434707 RepID=A0A2P8CVM4_9BACT|nr:hypothetical protein [Taibaiella chishuiensis]PSK89005.1 hypothetical protein B0I18_11316 [Taibaiella chishuiensis]